MEFVRQCKLSLATGGRLLISEQNLQRRTLRASLPRR